MSWGPVAGDGPALDWASLLVPWTPAATDTVSTTWLVYGGMAAVRITQEGVAQVKSSSAVEARLVVDAPGGVSLLPVADGQVIEAPAEGTRVWLLAAKADDTGADVTLGIE